MNGLPERQGLYDPLNEHDACGLNFVCDMNGDASHRIVELGLGALCALDHRGAAGADPDVGDGSGLLTQVPDAFYRDVVDFELPPAGHYGTGIGFFPQDSAATAAAKAEVQRIAVEQGLVVLGWRSVPVEPETVGSGALVTMPNFVQPFFSSADGRSGIDLDRQLYIARKRFEHEISVDAGPDEVNEAMGGASAMHDGVYFPSLSCRTVVYKGMLTTPQLAAFYPDLRDARFASAIALVHSRFSTNTFPAWPLAHPYRCVAHNGEINTIKGNRNWMRARQASLSSDVFGAELQSAFPICTPGASDTAGFDECLELLTLSGYTMPEAVLMMIPEPWENHATMPADRAAFYAHHATRMEPWDGPASMSFTDGTVVGAVLDRNGLRPSRYWVTSDGLVVMASEVGVVDIDQSTVVEKGRLEPGRIFFIDTEAGRIVRDDEIKQQLAESRPFGEWLEASVHPLADMPPAEDTRPHEGTLETRQLTHGWTHEDMKLLVSPMARDGKEALGSMGTDTPIAALSQRSRLFYDYFQQLFAQVTNPPLDAIREELITAVIANVGPRGNLLEPSACPAQVRLDHPTLRPAELAKLLPGASDDPVLAARVLDIVFDRPASDAEGAEAMAAAVDTLRAEADAAVADGIELLILSDRIAGPDTAPIPALLATAAVHHHLVANGTRMDVDLIVESGEAREVHHLACLLGFGARAVCPYVAFESIAELVLSGVIAHDLETAEKNYVKAVDKGLLKIMSKMGISTVASYTGAEIFESIGVSQDVLDEYFGGATSRLGGVGLDVLASEVLERHRRAFPANPNHRAHRTLEVGGEYQWRREGEFHLFNPDTVFKLQHATRAKRFDIFREYTREVDAHARELATLRGLFDFDSSARQPIPIDEVEPASEIVKRFSTGAMSYGSISAEAHETLALAMNQIGAKSNTGEGGEDPERFETLPDGSSKRSAIKQVASGRFGVTSNYLVNADDIQIKMAQGAKPGEGGQLPGHKVYPWIAKTRKSTPGVGLISPPPHHDIYSIEDLAQLIYDLKSANDRARVHVKLVSELGVGTVAAGVSKAHADVVLISGHDGGTGASPLTSIKHAGAPWELGLAETQQTLLMNGLRDRIVVQVDGQLKTGRDVVIAALLGADEFGFATAPLVVMGCVMMRVCHLNTCPVGVATQDPELRKKFSGSPEFVVNFFEFIAEEVREILASLGFRSLEEAIGQAESLDVKAAVDHWKADGLDLSPILYVPPLLDGESRRNTVGQYHGLEKALDRQLIDAATSALEGGTPVEISTPVRNVDRSVGTQLGAELTRRHGEDGLPDDSIVVRLVGSAGNSLGAFVPKGITLRLTGDANDFVGKGLSGGKIIVRTPDELACVAEDNIIAGNVIGYGATGGTMHLRGRVGERFCVRNSGATAVVEGVGDHGCEYMTGGVAVILGSTGRNFAAGMSGGVAFLLDPDGTAADNVNPEMVDVIEPSAEDMVMLAELIDCHATETGSDVAIRVRADWDNVRFAKVMPRDYARVLDAAAAARAAGTDELEAIMASARAGGA